MSTVLVVDDSDVDRRLIGGFFKSRPDLQVDYAVDGAEGLEKVQAIHPDLVLTDMQMPNVDGLQLVTAIRRDHSGIPVVLMTAHGSEAVAVKALELGAASYVPKSQLAEKLLATVDNVLAIAQADRTYGRLINCLDRVEFNFVLDNDESTFDPLTDLVQQMLAGMRFCDPTGGFQIGVALKEALLNALYRGNLELNAADTGVKDAAERSELARNRMTEAPFRSRRIFVDVRLSSKEASFQVQDEGPGFAHQQFADTGSHPSDIESTRGLVLMRSFMDDVAFNEKGNRVTLVKRARAGL